MIYTTCNKIMRNYFLITCIELPVTKQHEPKTSCTMIQGGMHGTMYMLAVFTNSKKFLPTMTRRCNIGLFTNVLQSIEYMSYINIHLIRRINYRPVPDCVNPRD
jgi:hypothetical protein